MQPTQEGWGAGEREELEKNSEPPSTNWAAKTTALLAAGREKRSKEGAHAQGRASISYSSFPCLGVEEHLGFPSKQVSSMALVGLPGPCCQLHLLPLVPVPQKGHVAAGAQAHQEGGGARCDVGLCSGLKVKAIQVDRPPLGDGHHGGCQCGNAPNSGETDKHCGNGIISQFGRAVKQALSESTGILWEPRTGSDGG